MAKLMKMLQPLDSEYVDRRFEGSKVRGGRVQLSRAHACKSSCTV